MVNPAVRMPHGACSGPGGGAFADRGTMSERQAMRTNGAEAVGPSDATGADKEYRSGVFAKARRPVRS